MRTATLKHRCPHCNVRMESAEEIVGRSFDCLNCGVNLTVPTPQALMTMGRPVIVPEIVTDDIDSVQALSPRTYRHVDDDKPVELKLGDLAGIKVDVDRPTRNAMATTFLGAILVALGAILFSMLGGKSKA